MKTVLIVSLRQLGGRWRLLLVLAMAALPVGLAALISAGAGSDERTNDNFVNALLDGLLISAILPIVALVMASASFGNEVEDKTLSYLVLRPVRRWLVALPKLLAPIIIAGPVLVVSGVATTLVGSGTVGAAIVILHDDVQAVLAVGVALLVAVVAYTSIFTWAGLVTTRALAFGLVYVFVWEALITTFLGGVRYFSVRAYSLAILHGMDGNTFEVLEDRVIELPAAIAGAATVVVVFFLLTVRRLRRMDIP